ncbi:hypothetical protein SAMN06265348_12144 [Pedobacter westerhofensis]|uniref:Uncharacterized protein n=1 Tax=Pedobacter westerhofensis TaxID=425512 RepID=A0A521FT18_9SPHI|nr:hypothetical protein [Pedobacter westerhofensis]SMO99276.1 hypothetical protein SAMN06265348_12144 [Pedobacter westerhofensis]
MTQVALGYQCATTRSDAMQKTIPDENNLTFDKQNRGRPTQSITDVCRTYRTIEATVFEKRFKRNILT